MAQTLKRRLSVVMKSDKYADAQSGGYRVTSLYLENIYRSSYNDKMAGIGQRSKFRVRAYNLDPSVINLEVKYKDDEYISKKHARLTLEQYQMLLKGDYSFGVSEEFKSTAMEELLISDKLSRPRPSVLVDYFREAFIEPAGNIRVTLDSGLSTSYNSLDIFNARYSPVWGNAVILEIKYNSFMPTYICDIFADFSLRKETVSKFVICTDKLLEVKKQCIL